MSTIAARVPVKAVDKTTLMPDDAAIRRMEEDAIERLYAALQKWGRALFRDVTADNVAALVTRLDDAEFNKPMRDALIAVLQDVAAAGVDHGRRQIEMAVYGVKRAANIDPGAVDWTAANVDAAEWATVYGYELIRGITATTRAAVVNEVRYFIDNSITVNQLRDRLMAGAMFNRVRAEMIAVTETTRAYAEGNTAAWEKSGLVEGREWQTANDELVCPICGPLHGTIAKMNEWFRGMYRNPPAHPRCRCVVLPVVTGDTEEFSGMWRFDQVQRDQWSGVPVGATSMLKWKPTMRPAEAEAWAAQGEYKKTLYHITDERNVESIKESGFRVSSETALGRTWGDGVYLFTEQGEFFEGYQEEFGPRGAVLKIKARIDNPLTLDFRNRRVRDVKEELALGNVHPRWNEVFNAMSQSSFGWESAVSKTARELGFDSLIIKGPEAQMIVFDPKRLVIIEP